MGKGALRPFFKGHSLKKEKEHEKKEVDKMLSHFVTLPNNKGGPPTLSSQRTSFCGKIYITNEKFNH